MPHICLLLADVGYRCSQPANPFRQRISGLKAIRTLPSLGPAFVESRICHNREVMGHPAVPFKTGRLKGRGFSPAVKSLSGSGFSR